MTTPPKNPGYIDMALPAQGTPMPHPVDQVTREAFSNSFGATTNKTERYSDHHGNVATHMEQGGLANFAPAEKTDYVTCHNGAVLPKSVAEQVTGDLKQGFPFGGEQHDFGTSPLNSACIQAKDNKFKGRS